jgi:hypothetical protein
MNTDSSKNERKNYEIPCQLLPVTEFDGSKGIPPEKLAMVPVGGFVRDELLFDGVEFDCSREANGAPDCNFFFELHEEACQLLAPKGQELAGRERARNGFDVVSPQVWGVIVATCFSVAPLVMSSILKRLWKDCWGTEEVPAEDIDERLKIIDERLKLMMGRFEEMLNIYQKQEKKNAALQAEFRKMTSLLRHLPEDAAMRTTSLLVTQFGWAEDVAASEALAISEAIRKKG